LPAGLIVTGLKRPSSSWANANDSEEIRTYNRLKDPVRRLLAREVCETFLPAR
jgi:hypothetical protein